MRPSLALLSGMLASCVLLFPSVLSYEQKWPSAGVALQRDAIHTSNFSRDAYAILMYRGDYLLQVQVLGQALLETGTSKDRVAMCTDAISTETRDILKADGWIIKPVNEIITSPNKRKFGDAYSKLHAWNMTEYERVVYLDLNIVLVSNIDRLFGCGTFCASYQDFDVFYSGVMVLEPSTAVFQDMVEKAGTLTAYCGGEEGFLNEYFKDFLYAPVFNWSDSKRYHQHLRLPRELDEHLMINTHSTKLWVWWMTDYVLSRKWTSVRMRLQGYKHNHASRLIPTPLFWAPYPLVFTFLLAARCSYQTLITSTAVMRKLEYFNKRFSHYIPLPILCLSYWISFNIVPPTMLPNQAQYVFWLWTSFLLLLFMGTYCCLCHAASGKFCKMLTTKTLLTLVLFVVFTIGHILFHFYNLIIIPLHLIVSQFSGDVVIHIWTKM